MTPKCLPNSWATMDTYDEKYLGLPLNHFRKAMPMSLDKSLRKAERDLKDADILQVLEFHMSVDEAQITSRRWLQ